MSASENQMDYMLLAHAGLAVDRVLTAESDVDSHLYVM